MIANVFHYSDHFRHHGHNALRREVFGVDALPGETQR
jgi:hypothetical protein